MKVKLKTTLAGPDGAFSPGQIIDVSDGNAVALVSGGFAEYVSKQEPESEMTGPPETGMLKAARRQIKVR